MKDRQQISDAYKKMDAAEGAKDADARIASLVPNYVSIVGGKKHSYSKMEQRNTWVQIFAQVVNGTATTTVASITFAHTEATVEETSDNLYHVLAGGRIHEVTFHTVSQDFWIKSGGKWLEKRAKTLTNQRTVDGHPVP